MSTFSSKSVAAGSSAGAARNDALAQAAEQASADRPEHEQRLVGVRTDIQNLERKIDRYLQAFEDAKLDPDICQQRIERHHARLQALRDQEADLSQTLAEHADTRPDTANLTALADQLDQLIATTNPEQAKELLRLLIKDIRVHEQHTIIPTYRVPPVVRATHGGVGDTGLEIVSGAQVGADCLVLLEFGALRSAQVRSNCYQNCYQARASRGGSIASMTTRTQAAENALASVRAEGLDPGAAKALLGRWARGKLSDAQLDDAARQISTGELLAPPRAHTAPS